MPGLRGKQSDIDTSQWTANEWRRARIWNLVFFGGWFAFFAFAIGNLLYDGNWLMLIPMFVIALVGGVSQLIWLARVSIWLNDVKNP